MLNYDRLKRCLLIAKKINSCLTRLVVYAGDPYRQSIELEVLCNYAGKIKSELEYQELEDTSEEVSEYLNSDEFISSFAKKWGVTDEEE